MWQSGHLVTEHDEERGDDDEDEDVEDDEDEDEDDDEEVDSTGFADVVAVDDLGSDITKFGRVSDSTFSVFVVVSDFSFFSESLYCSCYFSCSFSRSFSFSCVEVSGACFVI